MIKVLVSACLIGTNCKWNGKNNAKDQIIALKDKFELVPFCAEVMGGLPIPRLPSEIKNNEVYNEVGLKVTKFYTKGAQKALETAINNDCHYAILKDHSPSCGSHQIYDGNFNRTLIDGNGFTARLLIKNHIKIFTENEIDLFLKEVGD